MECRSAYTGVGSRETPLDVCALMTRVGCQLARRGWLLRSGGARGADNAFERGHWDAEPGYPPQVFLPRDGFEGRRLSTYQIPPILPEHLAAASSMVDVLHPNPKALRPFDRTLHTRNIFQVLGPDLQTPSKFLVYWAPMQANGTPKGGARTAVVLAWQWGVPTFNLLDPEVRVRFERKVRRMESQSTGTLDSLTKVNRD